MARLLEALVNFLPPPAACAVAATEGLLSLRTRWLESLLFRIVPV